MKASRRIMLKNAAIVAGLAAAPWAARQAAAQQKATKQAMQYQEQPKNGQKCANCLQFVDPDGCKVVDGAVVVFGAGACASTLAANTAKQVPSIVG